MRCSQQHIVRLLYLLSLLAVVVFLVRRDSTCKATGNQNHQQQHNYITFWKDADDSSPQGEAGLKNSLTAKVSQSEEGGPSGMLSPGPYSYIINEVNKCPEGKAQPWLVLLIATRVSEVEARNAIRQTWGNESLAPGLGIIRLFLLGKIKGELGRLHQMNLESESQRHHDIVQQDFLDTYNNLTIKTLMGMNWVAMHCPRARFVMKTDADMFVNTDYLIHKLLRPELNPNPKNYYTGYIWRGEKPIRDKNSKWYMSPELYPGEEYPAYGSGSGSVFSGDLAAKIYGASLSIRHLHIEDLYVGLCLAKLRIEPTPPPNKFLFCGPTRVPYSSCRYSNLITSHGFQPSELLKYWHDLQNNPCINA